MKVGPVTKLNKKNKKTLKKFNDDVMSKNCDVISIFFIYGQSGSQTSLKTYILIKSNLLSYKS